jgi:hypothetical protein
MKALVGTNRDHFFAVVILRLSKSMTTDEYTLREASRTFLGGYRKECTHAATLTLKQSIWLKTAAGRACIKLSPESASRTLRHALNRLDRKLWS